MTLTTPFTAGTRFGTTVVASDHAQWVQLGRDQAGAWVPAEITADGLRVQHADRDTTGGLSAVNAEHVHEVGDGTSSFAVALRGTWQGVVTFERTMDPVGFAGGRRWTAVAAFRWGSPNVFRNYDSALGQEAEFHGNASSARAIRVRMVSYTSGTCQTRIIAGDGTGTVTVGAIAAGVNLIGSTSDPLVFYSSPAGGTVAFNAQANPTGLNSGAERRIAALRNPASSTVALRVWKVNKSSDVNGTWRRVRNATLTTSGGPAVPLNRGGGANASQAQFYVGGSGGTQATGATLTAVSGGSDGLTEHVGAYMPDVDDLRGTIRLAPGDSLAWLFAPTGTANVSLQAVWWEEPV